MPKNFIGDLNMSLVQRLLEKFCNRAQPCGKEFYLLEDVEMFIPAHYLLHQLFGVTGVGNCWCMLKLRTKLYSKTTQLL